MKALPLAVILIACTGLAQIGQQSKAKPKPEDAPSISKRKPIKVSDAPVTQQEAAQSIAIVEKAVKRVLKLKGGSTPLIKLGSSPVTRDAVVLEFKRLFEEAKPNFEIKPTMEPVDRARFTLKNPKAVEAAQILVAYGTVGPVAPLVSGSKAGMSVQEFGDALGFFLARIAELTHVPDAKWSPYLHGG